MEYAAIPDLVARFGERELIELTDTDALAQVQAAKVDVALGDAHAYVDGYVGKASRLNSEREREIEVQERANALKERELKLYQEKWNIDAQGFSKNTAGNRIQAMAHTNASVYNQAKQAGLDEKLALIIADSFTYGANGSASVSAVNKAINDAIVQQAREKVAADEKAARDQARSEKKPSKTSSPTTSPSPAPAPSGQGGNTYVTNITLPNGQKKTVRYADAASKSENEALLRELAEGKGVAQ